jgi:hypothetical protein
VMEGLRDEGGKGREDDVEEKKKRKRKAGFKQGAYSLIGRSSQDVMQGRSFFELEPWGLLFLRFGANLFSIAIINTIDSIS